MIPRIGPRGLPAADDLEPWGVGDGGTWGQPSRFKDLAHVIVPAKFYWERGEGPDWECGYRTQDPGASAHQWGRELVALGHEVKLVPAQYVKPYVKRGKNDAADPEAICEAVTRPTVRFVAIKTPAQQSARMLHRVRLVLCRQRTQLSNAGRAHLAEFGIVAPAGRLGLERLLDVVADEGDARLPAEARGCLQTLVAQLGVVKTQILENDRRIMADARSTELGRRLMEIRGVGPLLASARVASVADPGIFRSGRDLAAWIGLVPRQNSSGGKERLGSISKAGHRYLRQMLVVGAMAVIRYADTSRRWHWPTRSPEPSGR